MDQHGLEAALEGGVLLDVPAVLVQGGRPDAAKLPASKRGLEHVGRVHRALDGTRPNEGVQFVNEAHDGAVGLFDLAQHGLQALLELAPELRAGHHRRQVQCHQALVLERFGNVAIDDPLGEAFRDGSLAHAGLANEDGIVLGAAREHLDHPADLLVAPDHRVELALPGLLGKVEGVALESLVLVLGVLVADPLGPADGGQRLEDGLVRRPPVPPAACLRGRASER